MAVPWINFLAPTVGGIGPIELEDLSRLRKLRNGIPFYAGRFYPKDSKDIFEDFQIGLFSETPPWLTWERINPTQIWMVPVFEDERILNMTCTLERIDLWPREDNDNLPEVSDTSYDQQMQKLYWENKGLSVGQGELDPGFIIKNNVIPPVFALGYVGISAVEGYCTEWGFYDQDLKWINKKDYGNPINAVEASTGIAAPITERDDYSEILIARRDGLWRKQNPDIIAGEPLKFESDYNGNPKGFSRMITPDSYEESATWDKNMYRKWGNRFWNDLTIPRGSRPKVGSFLEIKTSELDTLVYTIKVSCQTIVIPDDLIPADSWATLQQYSSVALQTLGSNLSNNIWYFYLPVRYDGRALRDRIPYLLGRAGINKLDDENYSFANYLT